MYCSNNLSISAKNVIGRSFFDFVAEGDKEKVKNCIEIVKEWDVDEYGQPCASGFEFCRFALLAKGRDSAKHTLKPSAFSQSWLDGKYQEEIYTKKYGSRFYDNFVDSNTSVHSPFTLPRASMPKTYSGSTSLYDVAGTVEDSQTQVEAILSAHSDGLLAILTSWRKTS
ncbi:hypothetical protein CPB83DRAFT_898567 [Crepidotus variabilis]|uniref:Uncharacterized protein n=1 Tax=Crepidotus variabilis TaxID=179855 RepID=A0A9P6JKB4_9AGAR|nr:hypothetical protein CPB83DRAFT_898567 [Crepidotus variabilis]